jgi:putative flippase GtrA
MEIHWQFVRYAIVGFCSNAVLYFIYLVVPRFGIGYKTAMTLLYTIDILLTFLFNRCWTFDHQGLSTKDFIRYISVYGLGYVFNLATLFLLQRFFVLNDKQQVTI